MARMGWAAFLDAHYRPFMIRADLQARGPQQRFELLQRLLKAMNLTGNYAIYWDEDFIRIAFELETDAVQVVRSVNARKGDRRDEWAGQWVFPLDAPTAARIKSMLSAFKRSPSVARRPERKGPR
jgi:hypothetical protein